MPGRQTVSANLIGPRRRPSRSPCVPMMSCSCILPAKIFTSRKSRASMADEPKYANLSQGRNAWSAGRDEAATKPNEAVKKPASYTAHKAGTPVDAKRKGYGKSPGEAIAKEFAASMNRKPVPPMKGEDKPKPAAGRALAKESADQANRKKYSSLPLPDDEKP